MRRVSGTLIAAMLAVVSIAATRDPVRTMRVRATAYCQSGRTKSGEPVRTGIVAADPRVLPIGTRLEIVGGPSSGIYTVMDTGAAVKGRRIDIFIPNCSRARRFGAQTLSVRVLRDASRP